jgi:hypothetical protein
VQKNSAAQFPDLSANYIQDKTAHGVCGAWPQLVLRRLRGGPYCKDNGFDKIGGHTGEAVQNHIKSKYQVVAHGMEILPNQAPKETGLRRPRIFGLIGMGWQVNGQPPAA